MTKAPDIHELAEKLWRLARGKPLSMRDACDKLDVSPRRLEAVVKAMGAEGRPIALESDHVGKRTPTGRAGKIETVVAPVVGRAVIGSISDLHYGSKYCLRRELVETVGAFYEAGVRDMMVVGDCLDGCYRHSAFELSHVGFSDQADDMLENLPRHKGLRYHMITGNHDATFLHASGIDAGPTIVERGRSKFGREDILYYGERDAFLSVHGAVVNLFHPCGSGSYALSYKLQKKIEVYQPGMKPHILLEGHFHQAVHIFERGIHAFLAGTFQGGQSEFGKSLTGGPKIGGWKISFEMARDGYLRELEAGFRSFYEGQILHRVDSPEGAMVPDVPTRGNWRETYDTFKRNKERK